MKRNRVVPMLLFFSIIIGCEEKSKSGNALKQENPGISIPDENLLRSSIETGDFIREASKDHSLPPYIRHSALALVKLMDGEKIDPENLSKAGTDLSSVRSQSTYHIYLSFMLFCERGLPEVLPSNNELKAISEKKDNVGLYADPIRFIKLFSECLGCLTEFDMMEADKEVASAVDRFERKYGKSPNGLEKIKDIRETIEMAKELRKTDQARWKKGRKRPKVEPGID